MHYSQLQEGIIRYMRKEILEKLLRDSSRTLAKPSTRVYGLVLSGTINNERLIFVRCLVVLVV